MATVKTAERTPKEILEAQPTVTVRIPLEMSVDGMTVSAVVGVQVNGVHKQIVRGETVELPVDMYLALKKTERYDI